MSSLKKSIPLVVFTLLATISTAAAERSGFAALEPGRFVVREQVVPVRLVFIGYDPIQINTATLLGRLPATYVPIVRAPLAYGLDGRNLGLRYRFQYTIEHKNAQFTNRFFSFLTSIGTEGPITAYQDLYNRQVKNVLDVTGPILSIDAPRVERYLTGCGGDDTRGYTLVFINWYGRPDFRFHVYTKTDEVDPDTNHNFGEQAEGKIIAWGGTSSRTWFYDLSAGPERWTSNWRVDDNQSQFHMPPIWEYRVGGYRAPAVLSRDLGLVARYVGIDLLFTTSPLYDPLLLSAPDVGGAKVAHVAMFEDDPASRGLDFIKKDFTRTELRRLQPYYRWKVGLTDTNPIDPAAARSVGIAMGTVEEDDCWNALGHPFAQLFCYFSANLSTYIPRYPKRDYVGEIFAFNTTSERLGANANLLGFADDNWVDGTPSFVFAFDTPAHRRAGFGFTTTVIHEFGHHIGMPHPHDGWNSETGIQFGPSGLFQFAWSGDESHSVMSYSAHANGFGRFDKDNMHRWETAGYLNWANAVAGDVLAHPRGRHARPLLHVADLTASAALASFRRWDYDHAAALSRETYALVAAVADQLGVETPTLNAARQRLPGPPPERLLCTIRHPEE